MPQELSRKIYYQVKPYLPKRFLIYLRKKYVGRIRKMNTDTWPIDEACARAPEGWKGWPEGKRFALVLTHDVDTEKGRERCYELMELEKRLGFRSSFNFVAEDYETPSPLREGLVKYGFEVGLHGLHHDGKLYNSKKIFMEQAVQINRYLQEWGSVGFRSPAMHHNLEWILDLNIEYDASTIDTDPFEPQPDGVRTVFPFLVMGKNENRSYLELPYTLPQDFTLFILMQEKSISIWEKKLDWIANCGGMALVNTHPDYMNFGEKKSGLKEYPAKYYENILNYIKERYKGKYWHILPKDLVRFWKSSCIEVVSQNNLGK